jgi:hypothetical protein
VARRILEYEIVVVDEDGIRRERIVRGYEMALPAVRGLYALRPWEKDGEPWWIVDNVDTGLKVADGPTPEAAKEAAYALVATKGFESAIRMGIEKRKQWGLDGFHTVSPGP